MNLSYKTLVTHQKIRELEVSVLGEISLLLPFLLRQDCLGGQIPPAFMVAQLQVVMLRKREVEFSLISNHSVQCLTLNSIALDQWTILSTFQNLCTPNTVPSKLCSHSQSHGQSFLGQSFVILSVPRQSISSLCYLAFSGHLMPSECHSYEFSCLSFSDSSICINLTSPTRRQAFRRSGSPCPSLPSFHL